MVINWHHPLAILLLGLGVVVFWVCCLGVARMPRFYSRLHFLGPAGLLGAPLIAAAVVVDGGSTQGSIKAVSLALILLISGPVTSHALARAARVRDDGRLAIKPAEVKRGATHRDG